MLSKRLQKVLDYISIEDNLADIGCDHGYLAMEAINKGIKKVQLVDNKIGPLNVAKKNLLPFEKNAIILYTLADGLSDINQDINVVAICGMGGDLITKILRDNLNVAKLMKYLILEANSKVEILRKFLSDNNFLIIDEDVVLDKNRFYEIIKISYSNNSNILSDDEIMFGPVNLVKRTDTFLSYLKYKIIKLEDIIKKNSLGDISQLKLKKDKLLEIVNETKRTN